MKKHYTIPFFILHKGCPFKCIFCDQNSITGQDMIKPEDVEKGIEEYLSTIPPSAERIEVGFFGGTFTGLDPELQKEFLRPVQKYIRKGIIKGIRLSTRPDYINKETLKMLKEYSVTCIELGVQSASDKVLLAAKRGHTAEDTERASGMILNEGFILAHQIMLGLPGSNREEEFHAAKRCKELGAKEVRIYPVIVIKDTELADLWREEKYEPLDEEEALYRTAIIMLYLQANDIKVIRCGLHPSEGLIGGSGFLAGPFHPAFRQKAESLIYSFVLEALLREQSLIDRISFNPDDEGAFFGFKGKNSGLIKSLFRPREVILNRDVNIPKGSLYVWRNGKIEMLDRKSIAKRCKMICDF